MSEEFSHRLRAATARIHAEVENRGFIVDLMEGRLDARAYALLLTQYEVIYARLEERAQEFAADPVFAPFADDRLRRHDRIVADLSRLRARIAPVDLPTPSDSTRSSTQATPTDLPLAEATRRYAQRLTQLGTPEELLAHHYTRYLGDLSGGQAIGTLMARHYGIEPEALTMWDFTGVGRTKPYKDAYRSKLDALASTGGDEDLVISEALTAFDLNGQVLTEIAEAIPSPSVA